MAEDVRVDFERGNANDSADIPHDEFIQGPPEIDLGGRDRFGPRTDAQLKVAWARWLESGHDVALIGQARDLARRATEELRAQRGQQDTELREIPERIEPITTKKILYGSLGEVGQPQDEPVGFGLDGETFDVGPPDLQGSFDPSFAGRDIDEKRTRWRRYLAQHDAPPTPRTVAKQRWFLAELVRIENADPQADLGDEARALDAIGHDPDPNDKDGKKTKAKWIGVVGGLLGVTAIILGATLGTLLRRRPSEIAAATDLDVAFAPGSPTGTDVTVTWKAPTTEPKPDRYDIALTPVPKAAARDRSTDGTMTSVTFEGVADGTYDVTVVPYVGTDSGPDTTRRVTVAAASPSTPPTGTPDPPTDVTVTAGLSTTSGLRGLTVAWTPPATAPQGYTVMVQSNTKPPVVSSPAAVGPMTSWRIEPFPPGTYSATVVATNGDKSSAPVTSGFVTLDAAPGAAPDAPRNLTTRVFASRSAADTAALTIMWDPPDTGAEVAGYDVGLTGTDAVRRVGNALFVTYDPVKDGMWTIALVAYNAAGRGKGVTGTVTVDHTSLDPAGLDWTPVFGADQIAAWKKLKDPIASMDESAVWARVLRVMEDQEGKHGGLASYPTMLFVARLLALWIDSPPTPPTEEQIVATADHIAATCTPQKFPTTKPAQPYDDRMAPWRAASAVVNPTTKKSIPLRYKLFGLVRTLERYLGEHA